MAINILINGVGGPTPRSIARSLHRFSNLEFRLIGTDVNPLAYGLYEDDLYDKTYLIPPAGHENYWKTIEKIVAEEKIDLALVQPEMEVLEWAKHKNKGKQWPCKVLLPELAIVEILMDKSLMTEVLKEGDLVPISLDISPENIDFGLIEEKLGYPFWIRSTSGSSGLGSLKVETANNLRHWITINPEVSNFIGSEFLPGRNYACKLLFFEGKLLRAASGERINYIMSQVAPSGITGNTSYGRLLNKPHLVEISERALRSIEKSTGKRLHGMFTADFKEDKRGKPYLTEINVRMVAFNFSFAAGGANFSEDIVRLLIDMESFDTDFKMYEFAENFIFLRDVDVEPLLIKESDIKKVYKP